jgi:hypothetical protein
MGKVPLRSVENKPFIGYRGGSLLMLILLLDLSTMWMRAVLYTFRRYIPTLIRPPYFDPEDGGSMSLRNVGTTTHNYTV